MGLLELIFPAICPVCKKRLERQTVCEDCRKYFYSLKNAKSKMYESTTGAYRVYGLYDYRDEFIKQYIFTLKRNAAGALFDFAAEDIVKSIMPLLENKNCTLCYAPRRNTNVRKYGYDHAKCIAKRICKLYPWASFCNLLKRRGFSLEQKYLNAKERAENVSGKFTAKFSDRVADKIVIFDDISTTGSTFLSCVQALRKVYPDAEIIGIFICIT